MNFLRHQAIKERNTKLSEIAWIQSHVVRAPLARMMGLINLLHPESAIPTDSKEILNFISSSGHELDNIIRDIVRKTEYILNQSVDNQ